MGHLCDCQRFILSHTHESLARLKHPVRGFFSRRPIFALLVLLAVAAFTVSQSTLKP